MIKAVTVAAAAAVTLPLLIIVLATASPAPPAAVGLSGAPTALAEAGIPLSGGRPADKVAATAIAFAEAQLGKPYQWGAAGPDAYDCSGLVYAAYAAAGHPPGRAPPTSGSKTARSFRCPRSSPVTCCSPQAATAPPPIPATS